MGKIFAVCQNKGGVLKTTTTVNLAGMFQRAGKRVLIIDADEQGNAASNFGKDPDSFDPTLYDVLTKGTKTNDAIYSIYENIDLLPSNEWMNKAEEEIILDHKLYPRRHFLFRDKLLHLKPYYDAILIDCPPKLGLLSYNALILADEVIIPYQPEAKALRSLEKTVKAVKEVQAISDLQFAGVLTTLVDTRTNLHGAVQDRVKDFCSIQGIPLFDTIIPKSIAFSDAEAKEGLPAVLSSYKGKEQVKAYERLFVEVMENGGAGI